MAQTAMPVTVWEVDQAAEAAEQSAAFDKVAQEFGRFHKALLKVFNESLAEKIFLQWTECCIAALQYGEPCGAEDDDGVHG